MIRFPVLCAAAIVTFGAAMFAGGPDAGGPEGPPLRLVSVRAGGLEGPPLRLDGGVVEADLQVRLAARQAEQPAAATAAVSERELLKRYCVTCHNDALKTGGLTLASVDPDRPETDAEI